MTLTRASVEQVLVRRARKFLEKAGMAVTYAGANESLADPIGWALRQMSYSVADITGVTDNDLSPVEAGDFDRLLDFAELRTLETILGNLAMVDTKLGPRSESLSQLAKQITDKIDRLRASLSASVQTDVSTSTPTGSTELWITF